MQITSPAFKDGGLIPLAFTRYGENMVPPLRWHDVPDGTRSFALLVEDTDAERGPFPHCIIYDIPAARSRIEEAETLAKDGVEFARNGFGHRRYDGPQPPEDHGAHHYHFRLAALDVDSLEIDDSADPVEVWRKACAHALAISELVGRFGKH